MSSPAWRKSSHSGTEEHTCIELADLGAFVGIRDSKAPDAGHLTIPTESFAQLVHHLKRDRPGA